MSLLTYGENLCLARESLILEIRSSRDSIENNSFRTLSIANIDIKFGELSNLSRETLRENSGGR